MVNSKKVYSVVIVGAGAAGLELAIRLLKQFGRRGVIKVTLVDESLKYIWKPLYHEVAVGTVDYAENEVNYITYSHNRGINFILGNFCGLDRKKKLIVIAPVLDENQHEVIPQRNISYDFLVIAVGSISNTFGIPGVKENCFFLDKLFQAERFQRHFLYQILGFIQSEDFTRKSLDVVIVGGGATGVELAAELKYALSRAIMYGSKAASLIEHLKISIIEGADRVLPNLSKYISEKVTTQLQEMGITVLTGQRVTKATSEGVETNTNKFVKADISVWAAGIKAPDFLSELGLEVNHMNQLLVKPTLQTSYDDAIFAVGDCAACPDPENNGWVPPRAQSARQEAIHLTKSFKRLIHGKPLQDYKYVDRGSLVSLSRHNVVGNLMGKIVGTFFIEGKMARLSYLMLQKEHQATLFGKWKAFLLTLSNLFTRKIKSGIKLH